MNGSRGAAVSVKGATQANAAANTRKHENTKRFPFRLFVLSWSRKGMGGWYHARYNDSA